MRVYLSGPMTGLPELNYPAFRFHAERLRGYGFTVTSPHELNPIGRNWYLCMVIDLWHLLKCDAIQLLPGWQRSTGARLELALALLRGLHVVMGR